VGGQKRVKPGHYATRTLEQELRPTPGGESFVLLLLRGRAMGRSWPCQGTLLIGRDARADVTVTDDSVSRRHAKMEIHADGRWWIQDLDSRNGVFVNGRAVGSAILQPGDRVQIGENCIFKFARSDALERQLVEAQKLEAVGRLASGIAHDYNNVLMVISANASYLQDALRPGVSLDIDDVMESVSMIQSAADRAADVTRQLLDFARKETEQRSHLNVASVVRGALDMASRAVGPNVAIEAKYDDKVDIRGAEGRLTQVVLNLCLNASDAMPKGGRLRVAVRALVLDSPTKSPIDAVPAGDWAVISVSDDGLGISSKNRDRIFEPFFTTKPVGQGTGLGLPMVHGIVTQHGGYVTVNSEPGLGTTFTIYLPRVDHQRSEAVRRTLTAPMSGGKVLLIDDDEHVRRATGRLLKSAGYEVLAADGGQTGIDLFIANPNAFQFVLLDLVMPGMSGLQTYRKLRMLSPSTIVILCSGGGKNKASQALEEGADGFVHKPFSLEDLMSAYADAQIKQFG